MKKLLVSILTLILCTPLFAQSPYDLSGRWYAGAYGGAHYNLYENHFSYSENGVGNKLITGQGGILVGYDLNKIWGFRATVEMGRNAGALNTRQTAAQGFYPYKFSSLDVFADAIVNIYGIADDLGAFSPKVYGGIGIGTGFGFKDDNTAHWQHAYVQGTKVAAAFRFGGILQYDFPNNMGIFLDLCGEFFADNYNGLKPEEGARKAGYGGFPLDVKGSVSFGVVYHFNKK